MLLSDYVQPDAILLNLGAPDKDALLELLLDASAKTQVFSAQPPEIRALVRPMVRQRESYGSTAIGNGILFPHARVPGFNGLLLLFATCRELADTPTPDGVPVSIACLVVMPAERPSQALRTVSALSRLFSGEEARRRHRK